MRKQVEESTAAEGDWSGRSGDTDSSRAVPRDGAPAPPRAAAPATPPARESGQAARRTTPRTGEATGSGSTTTSRQDRRCEAARRETRGRHRGSVRPPPRGNVVPPPARYYRGYRPWGYGSAGFGSYYGSSYGPYVLYDPYSPWYGSYGVHGTYGYPPYGYGYPAVHSYAADGDLRLKIRPRDAQVFVDGYFVGIVDDFDGVLQRLHLPSGPHRIEMRAPDHETLTFDVQIRFAETTKFEGDLRRIR